MPQVAPSPKKSAIGGKQKPRDVLPEQMPVTDDVTAAKKPSGIKRVLKIILTTVMLVVGLVFIYLFLLLGEPSEEVKNAAPAPTEAKIDMPMHAIESPGDSNVQSIADTFDAPVLTLYGSELSMQKSRIFDTAFQGGYARRVTISYTFDDGSLLLLESIRPTSAISLLSSSDYSLQSGKLYTLGGMSAARMDNDTQLCIFSQGEGVAYAVTCPQSHAEDVTILLRQTTLTNPSVSN